MKAKSEILDQVSDYYSKKIDLHGATPQGVDWNSEDAQIGRFEQILKIIPHKDKTFTILDYGCGYAALAQYMINNGYQFQYFGYDISESMIKQAKAHFTAYENFQFSTTLHDFPKVDFVVTSGIFNVRMGFSVEDWVAYMNEQIDTMWSYCTQGIAFNSLTSYSDAEYMRDDLYYADPLTLFDKYKRTFSKQVALLHDYGFYEFTMLIRRED